MRDVELVGIGGAGAAGEEGDDIPLLLTRDSEPSPAGRVHVFPRPNSSYTRDDHSWASKLVFSWIDPVLDKVRRSFPSCGCICLTRYARDNKWEGGTSQFPCTGAPHAIPPQSFLTSTAGTSSGNREKCRQLSACIYSGCCLSLPRISLFHRWRTTKSKQECLPRREGRRAKLL